MREHGRNGMLSGHLGFAARRHVGPIGTLGQEWMARYLDRLDVADREPRAFADCHARFDDGTEHDPARVQLVGILHQGPTISQSGDNAGVVRALSYHA